MPPLKMGAYSWFMEEDRELEISNLQVRIGMLRREEREWLSVLSDNSQSSSHTKARQELRRIMEQLLADAAAIKKLESEP